MVKVMVVVGSQHTDMPEEMRVETMELCVTACEKFATNNEVSAFFFLRLCFSFSDFAPCRHL